MCDYEMLSIMLALGMLVVAIIALCNNAKK